VKAVGFVDVINDINRPSSCPKINIFWHQLLHKQYPSMSTYVEGCSKILHVSEGCDGHYEDNRGIPVKPLIVLQIPTEFIPQMRNSVASRHIIVSRSE